MSMEGTLVIDTYLYAEMGGVYLEQWGTTGKRSSRLLHRLRLTKEELIEFGEKAKTITASDQSDKFDDDIFGDENSTKEK